MKCRRNLSSTWWFCHIICENPVSCLLCVRSSQIKLGKVGHVEHSYPLPTSKAFLSNLPNNTKSLKFIQTLQKQIPSHGISHTIIPLLTFCWQIIFLVIGVEVGGGGGGKDRRENSTVIIQSKWKMAAVKFRGEGLSNHNPA